MKLKALIFDVDGTMADTERDGHLPACNEAFARFNYPVRWTWAEYKQLLQLPGTPVRMRQALAKIRPDFTEQVLDEAAETITAVKRQLYLENYVTAVSLRPGIREIITEAVHADVKLAIITLSHEAQVAALLQKQLPEFADAFDPILGKEAGPKYGPGAPLYVRCLAELGVSPDEVLVIEDSEGGTAAAVAAGLSVVVTYNEYTRNGRFSGARLITPTLASFTLAQLSFLCLEN